VIRFSFLPFSVVTFLCGYLSIGVGVAANPWVIVSQGKAKAITIYSLDENAGQLHLLRNTPLGNGVGAMCFDQKSRILYVSLKGGGSIAAYQVGSEADLTRLGSVDVGASPSYLALDPSGKYLLSSYYAAGKICVHRVSENGALQGDPLQSLQTDANAHAIVMDRSGSFAFVPHTRPNAIFQFRLDGASGALQPNAPSKLLRDDKTGPRHLWFHPTLPFAYGSDEQGSSITAYKFDPELGTLTTMQTLSSLPKDAAPPKNSTSDIEVHPSGRFAYIANRGHDTIGVFSINQDDGKLTWVENTSTEPTTRSFNISPNGKFIVAAGQKSNQLAVFRVGDDGRLQRTSTMPTGESPWWVCVIDSPSSF
jgi:6-phosphogluconolactonase